MKRLLRLFSPKHAVKDFADQWQAPTPHRWQILGVAAAATFAIFMVFIPDSQRIAPARPEVMYISTFAEERGDAEIIASNCANQQLKDELEARIEQREELRRDIYRALGRATFVDVDAMEADIEADRAAEEQAAELAAGDTAEAIPQTAAMSVEEYCARAAG